MTEKVNDEFQKTRKMVSLLPRSNKIFISSLILFTSLQIAKAGENQELNLNELLKDKEFSQERLETELDQYIHFLEKVDPTQSINRSILMNRVDTLGVFDGLLLPALVEMDILLAKGDFHYSSLLNEAISVFSPHLSQGLREEFQLDNFEGHGDYLEAGSSYFNFNRSFGDENTNFGSDDFGDRGINGRFNRLGLRRNLGPDFGNNLIGDGVTNFGNTENGGSRGGRSGGFIRKNNSSPIFGNPKVRDDVASMTRGGSCVAGCGSGAPVGGAIGGFLGGLIGGFSGISVGGVGAIPGMIAGTQGGATIGGIIGCAAGCIVGPPDIDGGDGGGTSPKTDGGDGGGTSPKIDGGDGGGTSPKTDGGDGGGTSPKTDGGDGGGTSPKTDDDPKPGKKDERAVNSDEGGIFVVDDSNPVVDRRLFRRRVINNALSQDAPLINFKDDLSYNANIGN